MSAADCRLLSMVRLLVQSALARERSSKIPLSPRRASRFSSSPMSGFKTFEEFAVGDKAVFSKTMTEADILLFAAVSGDNYELHIDEEYAKTTRFGRRVVHGMCTA